MTFSRWHVRQKLSCQAEDFLAFSQILATSEKEIDHRNCASRAYYFALHFASRRAMELGNPPFAASKRITFQEGVLTRFKEWRSEPNAVKAGYILNEMKQRRVEADYNLEMAFSGGAAKQQLAAAEKVRNLLAAISSDAAGLARATLVSRQNPEDNKGTDIAKGTGS